jgi:fatty acid-binding protein DegV
MSVKIVTDSIADLPPDIVNELDITVIPVNVCFGNEVYAMESIFQ